MHEWMWRMLNVMAWLITAVAFYFGNASILRERVAVAETKIEQETAGYRILQNELGRRLERLETKMDTLLATRAR